MLLPRDSSSDVITPQQTGQASHLDDEQPTGQASHLDDDALPGLFPLPERFLSLADWGYFPHVLGNAAVLQWSPDGRVISVGYSKRGLAVWTPSGCRVMCSLRQSVYDAESIAKREEGATVDVHGGQEKATCGEAVSDDGTVGTAMLTASSVLEVCCDDLNRFHCIMCGCYLL